MSRSVVCWAMLVSVALGFCISAQAEETRAPEHEKYLAKFWDYIHYDGAEYSKWQLASEPVKFNFPTPSAKHSRTYLNSVAAADATKLPHRSVVVIEQLAADGKTVVGITAFIKAAHGFDSSNDDWYWAHFLPDGKVVLASADRSKYLISGFIPLMEDGRLWVFSADGPELAEFVKHGELAKHVVRPGAGPGGITLKGPDAETLDAYTSALPK